MVDKPGEQVSDGHAVPGRRAVAEALRAHRHLLEVVIDARGGGELAALAQQAHSNGVALRHADRSELDELAEGVRHQGVVARAPGFGYRSLAEIGDTDLVVVLDGVTDPQNLGAIARSAEAAGAGALVLPKRRNVHVTPAAEKASAGAFSWLRVVLVPNVVRALTDLADRGLWSVGLDEGAQESLFDCKLLDGHCALVVGAEGKGLSRLVAERVDARVAIPLSGNMDALNASVAAGVALFEFQRRRLTAG